MNTALDPMWKIPENLNPRGHRFIAQLDNYEPPRDFAYGNLVVYDLVNGEGAGYKIESHHFGSSPEKCLYLIDFGNNIIPCYVVTWDQRTVTVHPLPTTKGSVSFNNWLLGPRKTYHLKVRD